MGYNTGGHEQSYYGDQAASMSPEAASPYAELGHPALIEQFYATEGNPDIGRELSARLFTHAGLQVDLNLPLIGRDGRQVQARGKPIAIGDYVNYAAEHHFEYVEDILDFLSTRPGTQDYQITRTTLIGYLNAGRQ